MVEKVDKKSFGNEKLIGLQFVSVTGKKFAAIDFKKLRRTKKLAKILGAEIFLQDAFRRR